MKLELNHPWINLPNFQHVLKIKLIYDENEAETLTNTTVSFIRYIFSDHEYTKKINQLDNIIDFYKFSENFDVPMSKFKDFTIADIYKITSIDDALSPEITLYTV